MCTGAIPADRLPCRYPSVRMMAVCKSSGDENPCRKTRFPRSKPPSENPLGADPVACPDGTRGSERTSVPVSRQPVISAAREWYPCMAVPRRELTSNHTGNRSEWQSAKKCQCGRYGKKPRRNLADRIFAASASGRTSGCAHSNSGGGLWAQRCTTVPSQFGTTEVCFPVVFVLTFRPVSAHSFDWCNLSRLPRRCLRALS